MYALSVVKSNTTKYLIFVLIALVFLCLELFGYYLPESFVVGYETIKANIGFVDS